jgi:hypothetical protein
VPLKAFALGALASKVEATLAMLERLVPASPAEKMAGKPSWKLQLSHQLSMAGPPPLSAGRWESFASLTSLWCNGTFVV